MADNNVTIASKTIGWYGPSSGVELYVYATKPWVTEAGTPVNASSPYDPATRTQPYKKTACTIDAEAHTCAINALTLSSTEDASVNNDVTLEAVFVDTSQAVPRIINGYSVFGSTSGGATFRIPADDASTTWADIAENMLGTFATTPTDKSVGGDFSVGGLMTGPFSFEEMPDAPGYKVNGTQVVGAQGTNIPDPDGTLAGNTAVVQQLLDLLRGWGAVSNLFSSNLNEGLVSLWLFDGLTDAAGSNDLTNNSSVTFNSQGANFSGSNYLSIANNSSFQISHHQSFTFAARVRLNTKATSQAILSKTDGVSANEYALTYDSAGDRLGLNVYPGGTGFERVEADALGSPSTGVDYLVIGWYDAWADTINVQVDDGAVDSASATLTSHPYTAPFQVGRLGGVGINLNGSIRFVGFWNRVLTEEDRAELYDPSGALSYPMQGETTTREEHVIENYTLFDNRAVSYAGPEPGRYFYASPYSRAIFITSATSMDVEEYTNLNEAPAGGRSLNVRVNGADFDLIVAPDSAGAVTTHTVALPVGQKTVEIWNGFQTLHSGNVVGTWLRRVTFNAPAQRRAPVNGAPHMVLVGDSIAAGAGGTTPARDGWAMLLRDIYPGSIAIEAWGGRALKHDAVDGTARAVFVQKIVTQNPDAIFLAIGTNDFGGPGFGEWSAADFGTAYAALLDDLHAALPAAAIYAMSPLPRTSEAANNFSNTLTQYRTQISTACGSRAWATFVDGTAVPTFSTGTDLFDTVHPNNAGHVKVADYVASFFGL